MDKTCKTCQHVEISLWDRLIQPNNSYSFYCNIAIKSHDPVTGARVLRSCNQCRADTGQQTNCGPGGKFYQGTNSHER